MKILIIKLGAKGDVVRTLPILNALKEKYPDSEITWITKPGSKEILKTSQYIDNILTIPLEKPEELDKFDLLYNFDVEDAATDIAKVVEADKKYGFYNEDGFAQAFNLPAEYYLNTMFDDELKKSNNKTYQQMMFDAAELPYSKEHHKIEIPENHLDYAEDFVERNNLNKEKLIGIHLGASPRWPSKKWHKEPLIEFIKKANENGYNILLFGGPDEIQEHKSLYEELKKDNIQIFRNNPDNTDLEFVSLVNLCKTVICSDSYALHIAVALKKPTIGLFFCTSPNEVEDYGILHKITSPKLSEYFPEKMDQYSEELVKSISADEVLDKIKEINKNNNTNTVKTRVANAIIKDEDRILLIKRKSGIHAGKWAFPGGIIEKNETIEEALKREILEETGLEIVSLIKKISDYEYPREDGSKTYGECHLVKAEGNLSINREVDEARWITPEELEDLDIIEGLDEEALNAFKE